MAEPVYGYEAICLCCCEHVWVEPLAPRTYRFDDHGAPHWCDPDSLSARLAVAQRHLLEEAQSPQEPDLGDPGGGAVPDAVPSPSPPKKPRRKGWVAP